MFGQYVGYVSGDDGMHGFLRRIVREQLGVHERNPAFRAFRLRGSNEVYAYEEKHSRARVICKFYGPRFGWDRDRAARAAYREFDAMQGLRSYDLVGSPHHVVRPL
ncbi:MAG: aminoglycoside phosphotransferase, partial [Mycobacterium sp.]